MGSFGLNGSVLWLNYTEGALCFICKENIENTCLFSGFAPVSRESSNSVSRSLQLKIAGSNPTDGIQVADFIKKLNRQNKVLLLVVGPSLPFDKKQYTN